MLKLLEHWKEVLFPGFVATIGGIAGLVIGLRTPTQDRAGSGLQTSLREIAILYGALGGIAFWASFGPGAGLYTVLYRIIPPFSLMRAPARFGIVVTLALAVLAGIAVRALLARIARPTLVGLLLALLTAAELAIPLRFREVPAAVASVQDARHAAGWTDHRAAVLVNQQGTIWPCLVHAEFDGALDAVD